MQYHRLIKTYDVDHLSSVLASISSWSESEPGYYSLARIDWPDPLSMLMSEIEKDFLELGHKIQHMSLTRADYNFKGIEHADYDKYNEYVAEIGHYKNVGISDKSRIDNPWGVLRFVLFLNKGKMTVKTVDGDLSPSMGELYWIDHYTPHWFMNNSENNRYQLVVDVDTGVVN